MNYDVATFFGVYMVDCLYFMGKGGLHDMLLGKNNFRMEIGMETV